MRIAVSGAGGFLGSRLAERLVVEGHAVRALARPGNVPRRQGRYFEPSVYLLRRHRSALQEGLDTITGISTPYGQPNCCPGQVKVATCLHIDQATLVAGHRQYHSLAT